MIDIIVSSIILYIIVSLTFYAVTLRSKIRKLDIELDQSRFEAQELSRFIKDRLSSDSGVEAQAKEDFLNFVTQSRDWAYKYIEDVQWSISEFRNSVDGVISYWEQYGDIISTPHDDNIKKMVSAYRELIKVLPEGEVK